MTRTEKDALGTLDLPQHTLWGIHTQRAINNFKISDKKVPLSLIAALAKVKHAAAITNGELGHLTTDVAEAIGEACRMIYENPTAYRDAFPLDALQGGAGTSTNMNANEVVANLALKRLGQKEGAYAIVHPIHHINLHQSTNDAYPTALKIAAIEGVRGLNEALAKLQGALQEKEKSFHDILKLGRTEMQPAVPMTLGQEFSAFAEAVARDRWRTFKCEERLRMVNIGGTAIGTGIAAPRAYVFRVIEVLRSLTGMGLARSENLIDGTANADVFVEVSGILKAAAATFSKIANDFRLLHFLGEIHLPPMQAGSSIMPGKVNPTVVECTLQTALVVRANDGILGECAAHGTLQINEFMPLIASTLLESIALLDNAASLLTRHVQGIEADADRCRTFVDASPSIMTALLPHLGYDRVQELIHDYRIKQKAIPTLSVEDFLKDTIDPSLVTDVLSSANVTSLGYVRKATPHE